MRAVWFFGLLSLLLLLGLTVFLLPLQPTIVALQLAFSPASFQAVLRAWQPQGVALFRAHLLPDTVFLLCYGVFGYLLATRTTVFCRFDARLQRALPWLMPVAAGADAFENILHWILTGSNGAAWMAWVPISASFSSIKFIGIVLFGVAVGRGLRKR